MTPSSKFPKLKDNNDYINGIGLTEVKQFKFREVDITDYFKRVQSEIAIEEAVLKTIGIALLIMVVTILISNLK